jgi:hypothetical protein
MEPRRCYLGRLFSAGDCVWDQTRNLFWMGYGERSDLGAADINLVRAANIAKASKLAEKSPHGTQTISTAYSPDRRVNPDSLPCR